MNVNQLIVRLAGPFLVCVLLLIASGAQASPLRHQQALHPVTIARNARSGNIVYLQLDIAQALHYFEDEGLTPRFRYYKGAPVVASAVLKGEADFSGNSIDHAMALQSGPNRL